LALRWSGYEQLQREFSQGGASLAVADRATHWNVARAMIQAHPWLGVGPGRFPLEFGRYSRREPMRHAHNMLLHVAAETGLLALLPFVVLWGRVLFGTIRVSANTSPGVRAFVLHAMLMAFFIRSLTDQFLANVHSSFRTALFVAVLLGLAEASIRGAAASEPAGPSQ
jgi:O-antigen ligase